MIKKGRFCKTISMTLALLMLLTLLPHSAFIPMAQAAVLPPSYYIDSGNNVSGNTIYYYERVVGSSGAIQQEYRLYEGGELYPCDQNGTKTGPALTQADLNAERPQPSHYLTDGTTYANRTAATVSEKNEMIQYDFVGKYRYNFAATGSLFGGASTNQMLGFLRDEKPGMPIPVIQDTRYGCGPVAVYNSGTGTYSSVAGNGNGSFATLTAPEKAGGGSLEASNIKHAFLVVESSFDKGTNPAAAYVNTAIQDMANRPMTLVGPKDGTMLSNGYLPEGFKGVNDDGNGTALSFSGGTPSIFLFTNDTRYRTLTITDVTDFVREQGYGVYYGYNIPTAWGSVSTFADVGCGWQLIVIEEDLGMETSRVGSLQFGVVYNAADMTLTVPFGGYKTPSSGDFSGQLLFSSFGSNPAATQCMVKMDPDGKGPTPVQQLTAVDQSGGGLNRAVGGSTSGADTSKSFGQNIITLGGQRRMDISSYRMAATGGSGFGTVADLRTNTQRTDGMDVELLEVRNVAPTGGEHNATFVHGAEEVSLVVSKSDGGTNFITGIGVIVDVEMPSFESTLSHTDLVTLQSGKDVYAGNNIEIHATAVNVTGVDSLTPGLTDTQLSLQLDPSLTVDIGTLQITYTNYGIEQDSQPQEITNFKAADSLAELTENGLYQYYFDSATNTLTINFGNDFTSIYEGTRTEKKLYNNRGDKITIILEAATATSPKSRLRNTFSLTGKDAVGENGLIFELPSMIYTSQNDRFDTYRYPVLTKNAYIGGATQATNGTPGVPAAIYPGGRVDYVLTLANDLVTDFSHIVVTDRVPAGLTVDTSDLPAGVIVAEPTAEGTLVTWTVATLPGKDNEGDPANSLEITIKTTVQDMALITATNQAKYNAVYNANAIEVFSNTTYARWAANDYTVNYDLNGAAIPASITPQTGVSWGDGGLLPGSTPTHATRFFVGWKLSEIGGEALSNIEAAPYITAADTYGSLALDYTKTNITLQAQWRDADSYSIYFDLDGGTAAPPITNHIGSVDRTDVALSYLPEGVVVSKTGYSFSHWALSKRGTDGVPTPPTVGSSATYEVLADDSGADSITIKAVYTELPNVTITYAVKTFAADGTTPQADANGGTVTPGSTTVAPATGMASGSTAAENSGYVFVGWYTDNSGAPGTQLDTDAAFAPPKNVDNVYEAATYYAVFRELPNVTITYETYTFAADGTSESANPGGTVSPGSENVAPATGTAAGSTATAAAGYRFVGWYLASDTTYQNPITDSQVVGGKLTPAKVEGKNVAASYVALFEELPNVTITYAVKTFAADGTTPQADANGGTVTSPGSENVAPATGTADGSTATENSGYEFVGWYTDNSGVPGTQLDTDAAFAPPKNGDNVYEAATYYAVFRELPNVTITYETYTYAADGTSESANPGGTASPGSENIAPATGTADGSTAAANDDYIFLGWFAESPTNDYSGTALSTELTYTPSKNGDNIYEAATYVAVFRRTADIVIHYAAQNRNTSAPNPGGSVTPGSENIAPATGTAAGSTATAAAGYRFVGWYLASDTTYQNPITDSQVVGGKLTPAKVEGKNVAASYVALFEELPNVTIRYEALIGGTVSFESEDVAPATGTASGSTATENSQWSFIGWFEAGTDYSGTPLSTDATFIPQPQDGVYKATTYVAVFKAGSDDPSEPPPTLPSAANYTVEHYLVDGLLGDSTPYERETLKGISGYQATAAPKNYTGYSYQAGYNSGSAVEEKTGVILEDGSLVLRLYYRVNQHQIRYVIEDSIPSGAPAAPAATMAAFASSQSVSADLTFADYVFSGWRSADVQVTAGSFTMPDGDVTFYGSWIPEISVPSIALYTVEHYLSGGSLDGAVYREEYYDTIGAAVSALSKTYTDYDYAPGAVGEVPLGIVTADDALVLRLYYNVKIYEVSYEVTSAPAGAPALPGNRSCAAGTEQEVADGLIYEGHIFRIWSADNVTVEEGGSFTMPAGNVTFYGAWFPLSPGDEVGSYSVVHYFLDSTNTVESTVTERFDGIVGEPAFAMPKTGYGGYCYDPGATDELASGTIPAEGDTPLVLRLYYRVNTHSIRYEITGDAPLGAPTAPAALTDVAYGTAQTVQSPLNFTGYRFNGWYCADVPVAADGSFIMPDDDVTFYGSWMEETLSSPAGYSVEHYLLNTAGVASLWETEPLTGLAGTLANAAPKSAYPHYSYQAAYNSGLDVEIKSGLIEADGSLTLRLYYSPDSYSISYVFDAPYPSGVSVPPSYFETNVAPGTLKDVQPDIPDFGVYVFSGWHSADVAVNADGSYTMPGRDVSFHGVWTTNGMVSVTFVDGYSGAVLKAESILYGGSATAPPDPSRPGYSFTGWDISYTNVTGNITVTALWTQLPDDPKPDPKPKPDPDLVFPPLDLSTNPSLPSTPTEPDEPNPVPDAVFSADHYAYIKGFTDGTVRPLANITREEVAVILFRLLAEDVRGLYWSDVNPYNDVAQERWSNIEISTMASYGILRGYVDGSFRPEQAITRSEFVALIMRFFGSDTVEPRNSFSDVSGHWAEEAILQAYARGIISGYPDGRFNPDGLISRAEVMKIINILTGRCEIDDPQDLDPEMILWPDNKDENVWYYYHVQEATNSHYYMDSKSHWKWEGLRPAPDWEALRQKPSASQR